MTRNPLLEQFNKQLRVKYCLPSMPGIDLLNYLKETNNKQDYTDFKMVVELL